MRANHGYAHGRCGWFLRRRATPFPIAHNCQPISATRHNNPISSGMVRRSASASSPRLTLADRAAICHAVGIGIQRTAHGHRLAAIVTCASRAAVLWAIDRALTCSPRCRLVLAHRVASVAATRALLGLDDRRDQDRGHSHPCYLKWRRWPENEHHDRCTQEEQENCERVIAPCDAPGRGDLRRWGLWRAVGHVVSF
jgi:hypothetical protein